MEGIRFLPAGDSSIVMEFGQDISPQINARIRSMLRSLEKAQKKYLREVIPTYRSLLILYDPLQISYSKLRDELQEMALLIDNEKSPEIRIVEVPVAYGGEYGPDLDDVAEYSKCSPEEVISIHTSRDYLIYMLGFTPGFAYMGGMDERIATPRLSQPRTKIPAGSAGIAGSQTGIYPIDSPGGWRLIGRTPLKLYNPLADPPVLLKAGDYVRFIQISPEEYAQIADQVEKGLYTVHVLTQERAQTHE